jgi:hypothetical protein
MVNLADDRHRRVGGVASFALQPMGDQRLLGAEVCRCVIRLGIRYTTNHYSEIIGQDFEERHGNFNAQLHVFY